MVLKSLPVVGKLRVGEVKVCLWFGYIYLFWWGDGVMMVGYVSRR